ncbi:MAG: tRNA (adenosine(37)-N6)-threonylcarbamoyltransferase complex ATPase subunit type 1 TsaE [Pyrinomonadaceae bacterium]
MMIAPSLHDAEFRSWSPGETFNYGHQLGARLSGGEILLLSGPLGAGKTLLVKGICAGLGIDPEDVTSPSFTLVNPYEGRLRLYHIDLYRLDEGASAAHAVDLDELLRDEQAVIAIEWAERIGRYPLPENVWNIRIEGDGEALRTISIEEERAKVIK